MTSTTIRTVLFLVGLSILGAVAGLQLVRSVPYATFFYVVGLVLMFSVLQPLVGLVVYLATAYVKLLWLIPGFTNFPLNLVIGATTFASMLIREAISERRMTVVKSGPDLLLIWFLLATVVSPLAQGRMGAALSDGYGFLNCVILYLLITNLVNSVRRLDIVLRTLALLTIWVAVEAIVQSYWGSGIGGVTPYVDSEGSRAKVLGFSGDPNYLAGGLLLPIPFLFLELSGSSSIGKRMVAAVATLLICFAIFQTGSRGGALTLAVIGTLLLIKVAGLRKGVVLSVLVVAAIYLLGPSRFKNLNPTEPSSFGRILAWEESFEEFAASPLFGIGSGRAGHVRGVAPHSGFMQAAADLGLFGLIPWVLFILVTMKNALFVSRRAAGDGLARLCLLSEGALFGCLAWVITLVLVGSPYLSSLYLMAGLCVAAANIFVQMTGSRYVLVEMKDYAYAMLVIAGGFGAYGFMVYVVKA